jgi:Leucine-rich repeat (LRR) protein
MTVLNLDNKTLAEAQAEWAAEVQRFHAKVQLQVVDPKGQWWKLIEIGSTEVKTYSFQGEAAQLWLSGSGRATRWSCNDGLTDKMHVRVDGRGQLEVWSGSHAVAKLFDSDASPAEWCAGLIHVEASKVRKLDALLACEQAQALESLDLGDAEGLHDLRLVGRLRGLRSLNLNSCSELVDLTPLSSLSGLEALDLSSCYEVRDLGPLAHLEGLRSLDVSYCYVSELSPLAELKGLTDLSLEGCYQVSDVSALSGLRGLRSLSLFGCSEVSDLNPLVSIDRLTSVGLSLSDTNPATGLQWVAGLHDLTALTLGFDGEGPIDLSPISVLRRLQTLRLEHPRSLGDLQPLAEFRELRSLTIKDSPALSDISPMVSLSHLASLSMEGCRKVSDLRPLAGLVQIESLDLKDCELVADLEPLRGLPQLQWLRLHGCRKLKALHPIEEMTQLRFLDLSSCGALGDIRSLSKLARLTTLDLKGTHVKDLRPLANLIDLRSLSLSGPVSDLGPLVCLKKLASLDIYSERLGVVSPLAELPSLTTLNLDMCANIRDADALSRSPSLRDFTYEESATRDSVLLACATRRGDVDLEERAAAAAASFELSKSPSQHARKLVEAVEVLTQRPAPGDHVLRDVAAAFKTRGEVPPKTWKSLLSAIVRAPDPTLRPAFEAALSDLSLSDVERVLTPALLALADVPASAKAWALDLAQRALLPVAASATHAREVAPAAAVFFHSQGLATEVDAWLERGSVAQAPAWHDRVLVALLGRALRAGEILEARRLFALVQTPERRDAARGLLVEHLSSRSEFRNAAAELDTIVDRAVRASVAASALRNAPAWAAEPDASLSLLLALDGDPDTLAELLSSMIQQAPDSELVRHLAAVFAPTQGVDLAKQLDALLAHPSVAERVKPKQLATLRWRIGADASLAHRILVHGTAALLEAEGLADDDERAEITAAILGQPA